MEAVHNRIRNGAKLSVNELFLLTHNELMKELDAWASTNAVPTVDVIAALDHRRDLLTSWVHLSPEGNQIVAEVFVDEIIKQVCK